MPEIIEVRRYADFLKYHLNTKIINIRILKGRYKTHLPFKGYYKLNNMLPVKVLDVRTKGKFIYFILDNDMVIFNTLGLSGGWVYSKDNSDYIFPKVHEFLNKNDIENYRMNSLINLFVKQINLLRKSLVNFL